MSFLATFFEVLFQVLWFAIIIRILSSFIGVNQYNQFFMFLYQITEPILAPFRRLIPPMGGLDFSPIVPLVLLQFASRYASALA